MPEYSFRCKSKKCQHEFDDLCSFADEKFEEVKCPKCGKNKPKKVFTINRVSFVGSSDKMNNFEYAAKKNFEAAQVESSTARAEAAKRGMGNPYPDLPDFTDNGRKMNFVE